MSFQERVQLLAGLRRRFHGIVFRRAIVVGRGLAADRKFGGIEQLQIFSFLTDKFAIDVVGLDGIQTLQGMLVIPLRGIRTSYAHIVRFAGKVDLRDVVNRDRLVARRCG